MYAVVLQPDSTNSNRPQFALVFGLLFAFRISELGAACLHDGSDFTLDPVRHTLQCVAKSIKRQTDHRMIPLPTTLRCGCEGLGWAS